MSFFANGDIDAVVSNYDDVYEGNLVFYFRKLVYMAENRRYPYHNFRHMFHVTWLCWKACHFYHDELTKRQKRNLLVAALFHDFNHTGRAGNDDVNIERALQAFELFVLPEDVPEKEEIEALIRATRYPYQVPSKELGLLAQILRDADVAQVFSTAWFHQVVIGLAEEWKKGAEEVLRMQEPFLKSLCFSTSWAEREFPHEVIAAKIDESRRILALLTDEYTPET